MVLSKCAIRVSYYLLLLLELSQMILQSIKFPPVVHSNTTEEYCPFSQLLFWTSWLTQLTILHLYLLQLYVNRENCFESEKTDSNSEWLCWTNFKTWNAEMGNHWFCVNKGEELVAQLAEKPHICQEYSTVKWKCQHIRRFKINVPNNYYYYYYNNYLLTIFYTSYYFNLILRKLINLFNPYDNLMLERLTALQLSLFNLNLRWSILTL